MNKFESLLFYFFWMSLSVFFIYLYSYYQRKRKGGNIFCVFSVMILTMLMALRSDVGTDYRNYIMMFNYYRTHDWNIWNYPKVVKVESGFIVLTKILSGIFSNQGIWICLTILFFVCCMLAFGEYKDKRKFSLTLGYIYLLVFFYSSSFNIFRQMLAFSICLYGMKYLFSNDKKYFITVFLAAGIHYSSLIVLVFWFLWDHKNNKMISKQTQKRILFIALLVAILYKPVLNQLLQIPFLSFLQRYSYVLNENRGGNRTFILFVLFTIVVVILQEYLKKIDFRNEFYIFLIYLNLIIGIAALSSKYIYRLNMYFQMGYLTLFPYIPSCFDKKTRVLVKSAMVLVAVIYFILMYYVLENGEIFPYQFIKN